MKWLARDGCKMMRGLGTKNHVHAEATERPVHSMLHIGQRRAGEPLFNLMLDCVMHMPAGAG